MKSVYIIGSKEIPANYGGFETFVEKLTKNQKDKDIKYHVACTQENSVKSNITDGTSEHNGTICLNIDVLNIGPVRIIAYDIAALNRSVEITKENGDVNLVFYVLACRIGLFINHSRKRIHALGDQLSVNPDGYEWMRQKWNAPVRRYQRVSESLMVKHVDLSICDSKNIEEYTQGDYRKYSPEITCIAYGTELEKSSFPSKGCVVREWLLERGISGNSYYLVVGRFISENNYEAMFHEFMKSNTKKDFVLITSVEQNAFYEKLRKETGSDEDSRIRFVETVYNQEPPKYICESAYTYFHGHEVGGTGPSLLEALSSTKLNLLFNAGFNKEVGEDGAIHWGKNNLHKVIEDAEAVSQKQVDELDRLSTKQVQEHFSWDFIVNKYEGLSGEFD